MLASSPVARVAILAMSFIAPVLEMHCQASPPETVSDTPWRQTIHTSHFKSSTPPQVIVARGAYSDSLSDTNVPLDSPGYTEPFRSKGVPRQLEELPVKQADAVVLGEFLDHDVYMSPSHKSIYTTIYVKTMKVFKTSIDIRLGSSPITLLTLGGTFQADSGAVIRSGLNSGTSLLTPGHKYLLFLKYHPDGNFFTEVKAWELRDGKAFPTAGDDLDRSYRNASHYSGKSESSLISAVEAKTSK